MRNPSASLIINLIFTSAVEEIRDQLPSNIVLYQFNDDINLPVMSNSKDLKSVMAQVPRDPPPADKIKKPDHHDELLYIYTSGTTGLPKAAVITHSRYIYIASAIHVVANFKDDDVYYSPLPLYHTACGVMSIGQMLIFGSTIVLRKKFSASAYFSDCAKHKATVSTKFAAHESLNDPECCFRLHNTSVKCAGIVFPPPVNKLTRPTI